MTFYVMRLTKSSYLICPVQIRILCKVLQKRHYKIAICNSNTVLPDVNYTQLQFVINKKKNRYFFNDNSVLCNQGAVTFATFLQHEISLHVRPYFWHVLQKRWKICSRISDQVDRETESCEAHYAREKTNGTKSGTLLWNAQKP